MVHKREGRLSRSHWYESYTVLPMPRDASRRPVVGLFPPSMITVKSYVDSLGRAVGHWASS